MGSSQSSTGTNAWCCNDAHHEETALLQSNGFDDGPDEKCRLPSVIQFNTAMYYCTEDQGVAEVDIVRLGDAHSEATVSYKTRDGSAKAGVKYQAQSATIVMPAGCVTHCIRVPIMQDERWDSTLEFFVCITKVRGAQMGKYLHECRVSIIDDDTFPTNKYKDELHNSRNVTAVPGLHLLREYVHMTLTNKELYHGTIKTIILDFIKNLYFLMTLYLKIYLVDVVILEGEEGGEGGERRLLLRGIMASSRFLARVLEGTIEGGEEGGEFEEERGEEDGSLKLLVPGSRRYTAVVVGLLYICPFVICHWIDAHKVMYQLAPKSRQVLQANLMRKFLHYREDFRANIPTGDLTMAILRDVVEVVDMGYMKGVNVICISVKFLMVAFFIYSENKNAAIPLAVFPLIMGTFLRWREEATVEANEISASTQNDMAHILNNTIQNYRLIADFFLRPFAVNKFEASIVEFNNKWSEYNLVTLNNKYLPPWLTTLFVGFYMMIGTFQVEQLGGTISLGTFMATINAFKEVGAELSELYGELMEIQTTSGPLKKITYFLNLPTDLEERMSVNKQRSHLAQQKRAEARRSSAGGTFQTDKGDTVFAVDTVNIELCSLTYTYGDDHRLLLNKVAAKFPQGRLYGIVGPNREGKATLLKLIGQVLVPGTGCGSVFVPSHLRVLHLSKDACLLEGSLLHNLIFNQEVSAVGGMDRIMGICRSCGFSQWMLDRLKNNATVNEGTAQWAAECSNTDCARLNLARAMMMNTECLVMHMPLIYFSDTEALPIMKVIRQHVDQRGLLLPSEDRMFRRPRTVFFSSPNASSACCQEADQVFEMSLEHGLVEVQKQTLLTAEE